MLGTRLSLRSCTYLSARICFTTLWPLHMTRASILGSPKLTAALQALNSLCSIYCATQITQGPSKVFAVCSFAPSIPPDHPRDCSYPPVAKSITLLRPTQATHLQYTVPSLPDSAWTSSQPVVKHASIQTSFPTTEESFRCDAAVLSLLSNSQTHLVSLSCRVSQASMKPVLQHLKLEALSYQKQRHKDDSVSRKKNKELGKS